jgi:AcrR family transcriptional regulator
MLVARHRESERESVQSETRRLFLAAATEAFAREGYMGANINRISKAAGFAKGTIYNYFPSKEVLMLALIEETARAHFEFVSGQVLEEKEPARRLARFFEAGFNWVSQNLWQGRAMVNTLYGPDGQFKLSLYQAYLPLFQFVGKEIIDPGISQGSFRAVDADGTAALLMNIYLGTASQVNEDGQTWLPWGQVAEFALHALQK